MVIPTDLPAMFSLRTRQKIVAIDPEYPETTKVERVADAGSGGAQPKAAEGVSVYRVRFSRLGENMLRIRHGNGEWTSLEFFVTEPLETLIKKRSSFLVTKHQHTDPSKWYVGHVQRLGPEERGAAKP